GVACAALQVQRFAAGIFQAFEMFGYENGARILQGALFTAGVFAFIDRGLPMMMEALAASQVFGAALMLAALRRRWGRLGGQLNRAFSTSIRLLWVISIPIAVAIFVCAEPLVIVLAGSDYLEAVVPLRILIWITSLSFLSFQFAFLLTAVHQQRTYAWLVGLV